MTSLAFPVRLDTIPEVPLLQGQDFCLGLKKLSLLANLLVLVTLLCRLNTSQIMGSYCATSLPLADGSRDLILQLLIESSIACLVGHLLVLQYEAASVLEFCLRVF